jgi:DUF4097 and DUF4098 domain-containing protein YvlB
MINKYTLSLGVIVFLCSPILDLMGQDNEFHLDETYNVKKTGTIYLSSDDAEVFVIGMDRNDVHVKIDRVVDTKGVRWGDRKFDVIIEETNGDLRIKDKEWGDQTGFVGYSREEYVIVLKVPPTINLDLNGDDDDYEISEISGDIKMRIDDGDIRIQHCTSTSYDFDIDDGDITVDGARGSLIARIDDGDLNVFNGFLIKMDIRGDDSDIDIETAVSNNGEYNFRIDDSSLALDIIEGGGTFIINHDDAGISADRVFSIESDDENYRKYTLPGGNARIEITGDDMGVRLRSSISN